MAEGGNECLGLITHPYKAQWLHHRSVNSIKWRCLVCTTTPVGRKFLERCGCAQLQRKGCVCICLDPISRELLVAWADHMCTAGVLRGWHLSGLVVFIILVLL